jgi:general stress protein YciG
LRAGARFCCRYAVTEGTIRALLQSVERNAPENLLEEATEMTQVSEDSPSIQKRSGRGWHGNPEGHAAAGRKGGAKVSQNRDHMAQIGKKGGTKVSQNRQHMAEIGRKGGMKVSQNRQHMATIGKKGGESR